MPLRKYNIYKKVHLFDQEKTRIEQFTHDNTESKYCVSKNIKHDSIEENYYKNNCPKAVSYLDNWETDIPITGLDTYCIYLYYWIYVEGFKKSYNNYIKTIYDEFLKAYENLDTKICNDYKEIITDDILGKLHDLYEMNCKLNNRNNECFNADRCESAKECSSIYMKYEEECELNNHTDFCKELEELRNRYNEKMETLSCPNFEYQILPSFQTYNIKVFILMPFVMILIISIFLTILYKFTSCASYFPYRRIRKKNTYDSVREENNIFQCSKVTDTISANKEYIILYNSEYY
ncbi:variable surface protein [Plasmodium gonderi]|uniref:Variable surface protein n=1 Tax=Plasmodium gonderi TaxID=77519 RepID=A0A1Y1JRL6_PLAGO|nr:variable surface protein [Plasmodium gonderi]GAW84098.1 variable surface protein [Plasmodium gonderi]